MQRLPSSRQSGQSVVVMVVILLFVAGAFFIIMWMVPGAKPVRASDAVRLQQRSIGIIKTITVAPPAFLTPQMTAVGLKDGATFTVVGAPQGWRVGTAITEPVKSPGLYLCSGGSCLPLAGE